MGFYSLNPERIRDLQAPDAGEVLLRDGANLASVLGQLEAHSVPAKQRTEDYLAQVVPGVSAVDVKQVGPKETLEFRQQVGANEHPWRFFAANMSDGTLRALGILVALFQCFKLAKPGELERAIELSARKSRGQGAVLVLMDAEDDCPATLGPELLARARITRPDVPIDVVLAKREFEAWFLASAESLRGKRGLPDDLVPP